MKNWRSIKKIRSKLKLKLKSTKAMRRNYTATTLEKIKLIIKRLRLLKIQVVHLKIAISNHIKR
jgi:hypothetical protein